MNLYQIKTAIGGLNRDKWINTISVLTIATGLMMAAIAFLAVYNIQQAAGRLPDRFSITVFIADTLSEPQGREVAMAISKLPEVQDASYMSKGEALIELKKTLSDADYILDGLSENPLPATLDVKLRQGSVTTEAVRSVVEQIGRLKGVSQVEYGEKLLGVIQSARGYSDTLGSVFMTVIIAGMTFVCYSTVKILLYRKRDEIETLKVLGATKWFIRAPFVIEGGIIGVTGGLIALAGVVALKVFVFDQLAVSMPILKALSSPPELLMAMPLSGLLVGAIGALMAVGAIKY